MMKSILAFISLTGLTYLLSRRHGPSFKTHIDSDSLLWEISGNGLIQPSYLLGTMHIMCAQDAVLSTSAVRVIKYVDAIYLEADITSGSDLLQGMIEAATSGNPALSEVLTEAEYERVKNFFETHQPGIPFSILEKQHPLMLSSGLYEILLACEARSGIDMAIIEEAHKHKKEIKGLETLAFQATLFGEIPYHQQAKELLKSIDNLPKHKVLLDEMLAIYKAQKIEKLYELTMSEEAGTSGFADVLLYKRNHDWVNRMENIAAEKSVLFAVGAGHLGGAEGVINLLKRKGYNLRPIGPT